MLGNIINTLGILVGSAIGLMLKGQVSRRFEVHIISAMALGVIVLGVQGAIKDNNPLVMLLSLATGAMLGEWWRIEQKLNGFSAWVKAKLAIRSDRFSGAFVTATLLYCVGSMAIVGALKSGLQGDHSTLIAKGVIDAIISVLLASTMGIGIAFAALPVFLYQGAIVLASSFLAPILSDAIIADLSSVGSVLIIAIGLNMLEIIKLKVGNLLPAIFVAPMFTLFIEWVFSMLS